jgi:hypothetical protein
LLRNGLRQILKQAQNWSPSGGIGFEKIPPTDRLRPTDEKTKSFIRWR